MDERNIQRGTSEYDEVTRILGARCRQVADESVRQINGRWLKGSFFVLDAAGQLVIADDRVTLRTIRRRIRIPRDSFLRGRSPGTRALVRSG